MVSDDRDKIRVAPVITDVGITCHLFIARALYFDRCMHYDTFSASFFTSLQFCQLELMRQLAIMLPFTWKSDVGLVISWSLSSLLGLVVVSGRSQETG